jgi:bifunctional UDP-N-acetylglucosamine pyrophosphorylase / glucosamine-1-phosphate N-acetyltransferase
VRTAVEALPAATKRLLVVHGDEPMLPAGAIAEMVDLQGRTRSPVVLLTTHAADTHEFGRVIRSAAGDPIGLPQQVDLTPEQMLVDEVNLGAYVFDTAWLRGALARLEAHPPKGEYYLTDVVGMAAHEAERGTGAPVAAVKVEGGEECMGINDLVQLEAASRVVYRRNARRHMLAGVTIVDASSTYIEDQVQIGPDTVIHPFCTVQGRTVIGSGCEIGPQGYLVDSVVGDGCRIVASMLEGARVGAGVSVGPYAHLRRGAEIGDGAEIGNYAEIKQSTIGSGTKMHHMSYIGDAEIGANVNVGAGVITGNYDGRLKHRTVVEEEAFLGINTMLRAPVRIGRGAVTGAGAVVLHDVAPGSVVAGVPARVIHGTSDGGDSE